MSHVTKLKWRTNCEECQRSSQLWSKLPRKIYLNFEMAIEHESAWSLLARLPDSQHSENAPQAEHYEFVQEMLAEALDADTLAFFDEASEDTVSESRSERASSSDEPPRNYKCANCNVTIVLTGEPGACGQWIAECAMCVAEKRVHIRGTAPPDEDVDARLEQTRGKDPCYFARRLCLEATCGAWYRYSKTVLKCKCPSGARAKNPDERVVKEYLGEPNAKCRSRRQQPRKSGGRTPSKRIQTHRVWWGDDKAVVDLGTDVDARAQLFVQLDDRKIPAKLCVKAAVFDARSLFKTPPDRDVPAQLCLRLPDGTTSILQPTLLLTKDKHDRPHTRARTCR